MNPNVPTLPSSPDIPLHDINPLMEVPDNSLIWFSSLVAFSLLVAGILLYLLWRYLNREKAANLRKLYHEKLQQVTFDNPKEAAYTITKYGALFTGDAERINDAYERLTERLSAYKYRKTVEKVDEETIAYYKIYLEMIDV